MESKTSAEAFKALGDPTRLRIFNFLRTCCEPVALAEGGDVRPVDGVTVGDVCCSIAGPGKITSTMSFHLKELRNAGLITMERSGKFMICRVNPERVKELADYLARPNGGDSC